ncbi:MAG: Fpg/Nei family DNA glycosylase [Chitinophagaceae bacterium]|nr:MAG: Fpg/Nei family DNA glycosylase [Chitinophagaceae bacterium]
MPEIPDLEAFSKNLTKKLKGAKLEALVVHQRAKVKPAAAAIRKAIVGKKLVEVYRDGKQLRFLFEGKQLLGVHLMLHGEFRWEVEKKPAYLLVEFAFKGKPVLWLTDFHRQANIFLDPEPSAVPDVLDKKLTLAAWKKFLDNDAMIKNHLRNQDLLRGMGNAYTDEILYEAGISPFSVSSKIPVDKIKALMKAIKKVYKQASAEIKKNDPDVIGGEYRAFMKVHNSKRDTTPSGAAILKKTTGGSKTYYTKEQQLYK